MAPPAREGDRGKVGKREKELVEPVSRSAGAKREGTVSSEVASPPPALESSSSPRPHPLTQSDPPTSDPAPSEPPPVSTATSIPGKLPPDSTTESGG